MRCNEWHSGTSTSHPSARPSVRWDAPTVRAPSRAAPSCRWPGRRRSSCSPARSATAPAKGAARSGPCSASFRASPGFPLRFREGYCSCARATNCVHVAALVLAATDETLLPAAEAPGTAARRSALPWEQSLDSLLAAPQARGAAGGADLAASAPLAVELSLVRNTPERGRPSYSTDNGLHEPPADDAIRRFKLQARLVQPGRLGGWVAGPCPGPALTTWCCAATSPKRTCACCTSSTPCTGPAPPRSAPVTTTTGPPRPATATRSTWTCPRASPASSGPFSSRRRWPGSRSSTGASRAACRRQARPSSAST